MAGEYPIALENLITALARLPGIGRRTAERLAMALVEWEPAELADLGEQVSSLPQRLLRCVECGNLSDQEQCRICLDPHRDRGLLCVVEHSRQVPVIEKCGHFRGLYHVLGGRLSPLEGVSPEDLNIPSLFARVISLPVREIILSTSPDVEGEATAAYLAQELRERGDVQISRIALGIPVGADLSFADAATMAMAIDTRRPVR